VGDRMKRRLGRPSTLLFETQTFWSPPQLCCSDRSMIGSRLAGDERAELTRLERRVIGSDFGRAR